MLDFVFVPLNLLQFYSQAHSGGETQIHMYLTEDFMLYVYGKY